MHKINRDQERKFYNWWSDRLCPTDGDKPRSGNGANHDLGNLRNCFGNTGNMKVMRTGKIRFAISVSGMTTV
ncbi:MAG: hypothetical protein OXD38_12325 [Aestuariivita sp.]|nr:hypothetical protein [Aestuariivita sp.]